MTFNVVIPARYDSARLPGKPLIDLDGKPMIQRVYERAIASNAASVFVATDDQRIVDVVAGFGGKAVMTSAGCPTGTDRIHEAVASLGIADQDVVVNVQGDEPMIPPAVINQVAEAVSGNIEMATLCERIDDARDIFDPNIVKVVRNAYGNALYFSRSPVPWDRDNFTDPVQILPKEGSWYRHLGIYAYTVSMLQRFVTWPEARLERTEKLEQLRVLENGEAICVLESIESMPPGIDVESDITRTLTAIREES
jgi:3-deoxy-manno-octulosonate cytidylyltransferase (CMP-KDO synthetase)